MCLNIISVLIDRFVFIHLPIQNGTIGVDKKEQYSYNVHYNKSISPL